MNAEIFEQTLRSNILDYWMTRMPDELHGGFYGQITGRDQLVPDADKGVILNTRLLWTFSAAHRMLGDIRYKEMATRAFDYLLDYFVDDEYHGVYWLVDHKGQPVDSKKQIYAQAFAIYGLSEYYRTTEDDRSLRLAKVLFHLIETYSLDLLTGGYVEALTRDWQTLDDVRLSNKDLNAAKTMNTHLHILEAYTNLYRVWKDAVLAEKLKGLIELMIERFITDDWNFNLFFDAHWQLLSSEISYGHDIEGSWLLYEAAEVLDDSDLLYKTRVVSIQMANSALSGLDTDGGVMNEGNSKGVIDTDKHWWPQAEALVGFLNAWQLTGSKAYYLHASKTWKFIQENLIDKESGEWHWKVSQSGEIDYNEDKAGPWKCPYHNGRAMMEAMVRLKG